MASWLQKYFSALEFLQWRAVEHELILHCRMWGRLSNWKTAKNHSTQTKCLVCDSLFVFMETWKIAMFSFRVFLPNTLAFPVQSRPLQCGCIWLSWKKKSQKWAMHTCITLRQSFDAKGLQEFSMMLHQQQQNLQEALGVLSVRGDQGRPWERPHREDKLQHTSSLLSWQRWTSAPGPLSYRPQSHVQLEALDPVWKIITTDIPAGHLAAQQVNLEQLLVSLRRFSERVYSHTKCKCSCDSHTTLS